MSSITIYGASDDLIEVEGDVSEEWNHYSEAPAVLSASDGTRLEISYGANNEAFWRIKLLATGDGTTAEIQTADDEDSNYSDRLTLKSETPFEWVAFGRKKAKRKDRR